MPLFKVSAGSEVPVSAVVTSHARTMEDAIAEVRGLQARARVNWTRAGKPIGAIQAPYEIWAIQEEDGSWTVSLTAVIQIVAKQTVIAEDQEAVQEAVQERQTSGLIPWNHQGIPIGEYKEEIPTYWANQQPELDTTSVLSISQSSLYPGQSVTLMAEVSSEETPAGNVEFVDATPGGAGLISLTPLEPDPLTVGIARAATVVVMPEGVYSVRANYLGSDGFQAAQSPASPLTVAKVSTSVVLTPPTPPLYAGQSFSLGVQINHAVSAAPVPTGVITLFQGSTILAAKQVVPSGGFSSESFGLGTLTPGSHSFSVQYDGDAVHSGSTASVSGIVVQQATTTTTIEVLDSVYDMSLSEAHFSQPVRLRVTVTSVVPGTYPTGTVSFKDGVSTIATATLAPNLATNNASRATVVLSNFSVSSHSLSAQYPGNASFAASSSGTSSLTVVPAFTYVNAYSTNSPTKFGQAAQFDATVEIFGPATKTPFQQFGTSSGVNFVIGGPIFPVNFNGSGHALISPTNLPVGYNTITAQYVGVTEFNGANSQFGHFVEKADTQLTFFSNQSPVSWAINFRLIATANAVAPGAGSPTGIVFFSVYDPYYYGDLFLGSMSLTSQTADFSLNFFALVTDTYTFTAHYAGDDNFNPSDATYNLLVFGYFF